MGSATVEGSPWIFNLPSLGADMDVGTIIEWRVGKGDVVKKGDVVARVETEKSDIDVEIWSPGVVSAILAKTGSQIPVGTPILELDGPGPTHVQEVGSSPPTATIEAVVEVVDRRPGRQKPSSPLARTLAHDHKIDLTSVSGSGPGGAIVARDVDRIVLNAPTKGLRRDRGSASDRMRQTIAARMARSNADIPHYHLDLDIDMATGLDWLHLHNESRSPSKRLLSAALLIRAVALTATEVPELNGFWVDGSFEPGDGVNVGVVVSLRGGGLAVPVIPDADSLSIEETMVALRDVVNGARSGTLRTRWTEIPTITLSNLGDNGADRMLGVIFPPQVALVGFGRIREIPIVRDGQVVASPTITATLSADHRATDGGTGGRFLSSLSRHLQKPEE